MKLVIAEVVLPDGKTLQHRVIRYPGPTAGVLMHDRAASAVLLIWRHRFITDHWGWEIPAGLAESGEEPATAAAREAVEETGYEAGQLKEVIAVDTSSGLMDERFHGFYSDSWRWVSDEEKIEAEAIEWVPTDSLQELIKLGDVQHAHSLLTILMSLQLGLLRAT